MIVKEEEVAGDTISSGTTSDRELVPSSPLRDGQQQAVKSPDLNPVIPSVGRGLAAMTALSSDTAGNQGIVFKSHNISFTHKIPANLATKPRCLPTQHGRMVCLEQYSGPICASRTLRKGGYV